MIIRYRAYINEKEYNHLMSNKCLCLCDGTTLSVVGSNIEAENKNDNTKGRAIRSFHREGAMICMYIALVFSL